MCSFVLGEIFVASVGQKKKSHVSRVLQKQHNTPFGKVRHVGYRPIGKLAATTLHYFLLYYQANKTILLQQLLMKAKS